MEGEVAGCGVTFLTNFGLVGVVVLFPVDLVDIHGVEVEVGAEVVAAPKSPLDPRVKGSSGVCFLCNLGADEGSASLTKSLARGRAVSGRFMAEMGPAGWSCE